MKLNDLDNKNYAKRALKEGFEVSFDVSSLNKSKTRTMLNKVTSLIKEAKQAKTFYKNPASPSYMKLLFMEQALNSHYKDLLNSPRPRVVFENEEVEKSQVILAAQDMLDSIQKMIEDVSDMQVKELPSLVDSIQTEIGVNESSEFNNQVTEALSSLSTTLQSSRTALQGALGVITGQEGMDSFDTDSDDMEIDDMDDGEESFDDFEMDDLGQDDTDDLDIDMDLDEPEDFGNVGRAKR